MIGSLVKINHYNAEQLSDVLLLILLYSYATIYKNRK